MKQADLSSEADVSHSEFFISHGDKCQPIFSCFFFLFLLFIRLKHDAAIISNSIVYLESNVLIMMEINWIEIKNTHKIDWVHTRVIRPALVVEASRISARMITWHNLKGWIIVLLTSMIMKNLPLILVQDYLAPYFRLKKKTQFSRCSNECFVWFPIVVIYLKNSHLHKICADKYDWNEPNKTQID